MPPKKATATAKKSASSAPAHASYQDMIKEAVINLKDRQGSSRQALKKYVLANNNLGGISDGTFTTQFNRALQRGSDTGVFSRPKGTSGPVKLGQPKTATAETKPAAKTTTKAPAKKAAKTTTAPKKAPAKTAAKKTSTATKKAPAKKATTTKSKANTSKPRKTPAAAPAVEEKPPVTLTKTKTGRVVKSKAPQPDKKATTTKKKAPAKKAAPRKSATPKKA